MNGIPLTKKERHKEKLKMYIFSTKYITPNILV